MSALNKLRQAFPELQDASDSELVGEVSKRTGVSVEEVSTAFGVAPRGTASEVARQFGAGLAVDLPRMVGQGLKYTGIAPETGEALVQSAEERAPGWQPDMRGRGVVGQALVAGGRGLGPVAASVPLFFVPGGQAVAPLAVGGLFGTSSAQDTYEKLISQGVSEEEASAAARRVGVLQGAGEAAASFVGARTIAPLARGLTGARTTGQVADRLTDTRVLAPFARAYATNLAVQPTTEAIQDVGTEYIERAYGAAPEDAGQIAAESAKAGFGMALLLGPFNFGGSAIRARRSEELKQALYGADTDPQVRAQAIDAVMAEARRQNIAPENVDAWFEQQLQIEDARTEALREAEERAAAEAQANRDKTLTQMVAEEGLTAQPTDQDLLTPGRTSAQAINQAMGLTRKPVDPKKYVKSFEQAFNEPSGQFGADPETGVERELTVGELYQMQNGVLDLTQDNPAQAAVAEAAATQTLRDPRALFLRDTLGVVPTAPALQLMDAIEQAGIPLDSDIASPVITFAAQRPMGKKQLTRALQLLDEAVINSRRAAAPVVSEVPGVSESAGVSPAAVPAVAGLSRGGQVAPTTTQAPVAPAAAPVAPTTAAQIGQAPSAPATPAPVIQEGTPSGITTPQAQQTETQGQAAPAAAPAITAEDGYASDAEAWDDFRPDGAPEFDALAPALKQAWGVARRQGTMSMDIAQQIAEENGGEAQATDPRVALIAQLFDGKKATRNAEMFIDRVVMGMGLKDLGEKYGLSTAAVGKIVGGEKDAAARMQASMERAQARGVNVEAVQEALRGLATEAQARGELDIQNMFGDVDATSAEAAQADLGTRASSVGGSGANTAARLDAKEKRTFEILEALATERSPQKRAELEAELTAITQAAREVERRTQEVIRANAKKSGKEDEAAWEQEGRDVVDELGAEDAVQEQSAAGVPVQPEAEAGQKVGRQVRRAEKPAAEGQAITEAEQAAQAWDVVAAEYPTAPKFADLTAEQQENFIDFGPENWTKADVETELTKLARAATRRYEYPTPPPGAPAYVEPAQRAVVDFMNGEVTKQQLLERFAKLGMTEGQIRSVTNRIDITKGEIDSVKALKAELGFTRMSRRVVTTTDADGVEFEATEASLDELSGFYDGVDRALGMIDVAGLDNALNAVDSWMVTTDPVGWDAIYTNMNGRRTIVLSHQAMRDPATAAISTLHEIAHAAEGVSRQGGNFSGQPDFNIRRRGGKVVAMQPGSVAAELIDHFNNEDTALSELLGYPLDPNDALNNSLGVDAVREEMFAQAWAFAALPDGMQFLKDNLPATAAFMERVNAEIQQANYAGAQGAQPSAQPGQVQGGPQAASNVVRASRQATNSRQAREGVNQATRAQPRGTRLNNINRLPKQVQQPANNIAGTLSDVGGKFLDKVMFTSDLVKRATNLGLKSADNLLRSLSARDFAAREEERAIEAVLDLYADVPQAERGTGDGSVNRFIFDSTRTGKWGYGPKADPEMKARFNLLSPQSQKLVEAMFDHGDRMLARKKDVVLKNTTSVFDAQIAAAKTDKEKAELRTAKKLSLKRYESLFAITEGRPYAPIKRTGNYVVIAKSPRYLAAEAVEDTKQMEKLQASGDDYHVSFVDGKNAGRTLMQQLQDQGGFGDVQLAERDAATDELFSNETALQQLTKLRTNVDDRVKAGEKEAAPLLKIINQMYLDALAEGSARKSEMKRRGVDGEVDMIASFGTQGRADANFLASLQFNEQVSNDLNRMRAEAKTGDRTRKSEVLNEIVRRYTDSLELDNSPLVNKLTRLSSLYFLVTSPAYHLQNLTQPFMMSVPAMAGEHSYAKVNAELFKAYGELAPMMKSASLMKQLDFTKVPDDVKNAINQLVNRGRVDIGLDTEIGEFKVDGESRLGAAWNTVDKGLRAVVQKGESINRLSTAIAAYRLAMSKQGTTADQAIDYAERILLETHGDYSRFNAPRVFNTSFGRIALQFRKFQLIQISWYAKMIKEAYSNPEQRGAALRALAFSLAHTGVLAGAIGLPGYAAVAWALGALFGDDDDEAFDLTDEIRKLIGDEDLANLVLRGAPTLGGADLSGKIGAGNMLSVMPFSNADLTTRAGFYEALGTLIGGASAGMVVRGADGLGLLANGDYLKGMELMMPKGLGDMVKAYRLGVDGATRRNNDVILPADELNSLELMWQALGVPPAQITAMYEKQQRVRDVEQRFTDRTSRIKNDYSQAIRKGDSAAAAEARAAWMKLQEARVRAGLKRQPLSNLLKAPREQQKRERETAGGVQFTRATRGMVEDITER